MTPDLQSTLDAIGTLEQLCGTCDAPLGPDAPSRYWCSPGCQEVWASDRVEPLVGYREPRDLPHHVDNQVEGDDLDDQDATTFWIHVPVYGPREEFDSLARDYRAHWLSALAQRPDWEPADSRDPCKFEWRDGIEFGLHGDVSVLHIHGRVRRIDPRRSR